MTDSGTTPSQQKIGLDDYLLTHTVDELAALEVVDIDAPELSHLADSYDQWKAQTDKVEDIGFRHTTDVGNTERLALRNREDANYLIHYCEDAGWRYFAGTHWKRDTTSEIPRRAVRCVKLIYDEAHQCKDDERQKALYSWAMKSQAAGRISAMIELCRAVPQVSIDIRSWDCDPWLLNLKNGVLNLHTAQLRGHRSSDLITKLIDIDYNPEALCPLWDSFLSRIVPST